MKFGGKQAELPHHVVPRHAVEYVEQQGQDHAADGGVESDLNTGQQRLHAGQGRVHAAEADALELIQGFLGRE